MKVAFGHMHYSPNQFWEFTLREWQACMKGYIEKTQGDRETPMTSSDLNSLMERYPDGTG